MTDRDDFTKPTKRRLAERAAWRCGYPDCATPTIGPADGDDKAAVIMGEAAHITGAAPEGPRHDGRLSREQRRDISNGIWMCRYHAGLIDSDEDNYSAETLRMWKADTERAAADALKAGVQAKWLGPSTLVALGFNHVLQARWVRGGDGEWHFDCIAFVRGSERSMLDEIEAYDNVQQLDRFVVVESQGDGRLLSGAPRWERHDEVLRLILPVAPRAPRSDPKQLGKDFALGTDGDIHFGKDDVATVSGVANAIQKLSLVTSTGLGERVMLARLGSLCSYYFYRFAADLQLLGRLIKLELARLATIPIELDKPPVLNFVWRVESAELSSRDLSASRGLIASVTLEWADRTHWSGAVQIYIHEEAKLRRLDPWIRI